MKTSFRLTAILLVGLLVLVMVSGCTSSNNSTSTTADNTPTLTDDHSNTTDVDTTVGVLGDNGDSGVSANDLDTMQSDLDQLDSEVSGVSETN